MRNDRAVIAFGVLACSCMALPPVLCRVENCINPVRHCHREAVLQKVPWARLAHRGIEVTSDDHRLTSHLLLDHPQHVPCTGVALVGVTSSTIATVDTPVRVEVPERASTSHVGQLGPRHIARAPLACGLDVSGARVPTVKSPGLTITPCAPANPDAGV